MSTPGQGRGHTRNPILYLLANPEAKATLYRLEKAPGPQGYEEFRVALRIAPQTFQRVARRLSQFDLLRLRAPRGAEFEDGRIRVALELSPRGHRLLALLHDMDRLVRQHERSLGPETVASYFEAEA